MTHHHYWADGTVDVLGIRVAPAPRTAFRRPRWHNEICSLAARNVCDRLDMVVEEGVCELFSGAC